MDLHSEAYFWLSSEHLAVRVSVRVRVRVRVTVRS